MSNELDRQPSIRYATASDGVNLAFWTLGDGPPLLFTPPYPLGNIQLEWQNPMVRAFYRRLALNVTLVRYDPRGAGLSDREVSDCSLEARVADIAAVAERAGLAPFALLGFGHMGPAALAYAARYPSQLSRLILWYSYARYTDYVQNPRVEAARSIIERDWHLYTELEGYRSTNWSGGEEARWYTEYIRQSVSAAGLRAAFDSLSGVDVTDVLGSVEVSTLVLHREKSDILPVQVARDMAAAIPDARLALVPGTGISPFADGAEGILAEIEGFLGGFQATAGLTPREVEVLRLVAAGRTSKEISADLTLSIRTVGRHITNIYTKIGARTRADATAYAIRHDLA